jgi:hypothetical protein
MAPIDGLRPGGWGDLSVRGRVRGLRRPRLSPCEGSDYGGPGTQGFASLRPGLNSDRRFAAGGAGVGPAPIMYPVTVIVWDFRLGQGSVVTGRRGMRRGVHGRYSVVGKAMISDRGSA